MNVQCTLCTVHSFFNQFTIASILDTIYFVNRICNRLSGQNKKKKVSLKNTSKYGTVKVKVFCKTGLDNREFANILDTIFKEKEKNLLIILLYNNTNSFCSLKKTSNKLGLSWAKLRQRLAYLATKPTLPITFT